MCTGGSPPGRQLGAAPGGRLPGRNPSLYVLQPREKQKAKAFYGVGESQMRRYI
ncbi:MAG: 30S ribosomal protein S4, partial [Actinomycetota bacterium]|nr:30S ribosomal protein S4 [Actinomycetota bacterium]